MRYRWNPWEDLERLQREVNSLFERRQPGGERNTTTPEWSWRPLVDIYEDVERYLVIAEVPGIDPSKVELKVEDHNLTLRGERGMEFADKRDNYHRVERDYGIFTRTFSLPNTVDAEKIQAEYKHGLLRITIPKRTEVQPKQISVKVTE
jgi:HSP20 family protein